MTKPMNTIRRARTHDRRAGRASGQGSARSGVASILSTGERLSRRRGCDWTDGGVGPIWCASSSKSVECQLRHIEYGPSSHTKYSRMGGKIVAHYTATSVIYGSQAGVLPFGYALFLVTDAALNRLNQSGGWEVGKDAGVLIMPAGTATLPDGTMDKQTGTMDATAGTMTNRAKARGEAYAFVIGDTSIMTGVGGQGWKIIKPNP